MNKERIKEIINQVLYNPQVTNPVISYTITDHSHTEDKSYTSEYIDKGDFEKYLKRLEKQLIDRLSSELNHE